MKLVKNNLNEEFSAIWISFLRTQDIQIRFQRIQHQISAQIQNHVISILFSKSIDNSLILL
jgi:hypothetical protein